MKNILSRFLGQMIALGQKIVIWYYRQKNKIILKPFGNDFYFTLRFGFRKKRFSLVLLSEEDISKYRNKTIVPVISRKDLQKFAGTFKYSDELKNSFVVTFCENKELWLVNDHRKGFEKIAWHDMQLHLFFKQKLHSTNKFYILSKPDPH